MHSEYVEHIKRAMRSGGRWKDKGRQITMRQLAAGAGFSYEHVRKVVGGEFIPSEDCNDAICEFLGLNKESMWQIARGEKLRQKNPDLALRVLAPADTSLRELWSELTAAQKQEIREYAKAFAIQNRMRAEVANTHHR